MNAAAARTLATSSRPPVPLERDGGTHSEVARRAVSLWRARTLSLWEDPDVGCGQLTSTTVLHALMTRRASAGVGVGVGVGTLATGLVEQLAS